MRTDPTFYPSPKLAMEAPRETYGYVVNLCTDGSMPDALSVVDLDPRSGAYGQVVHQVRMPNIGDELHHFGWNACSSVLSPMGGHPFVERRFLVIPGIRSSRIYIVDTKPHPTQSRIVKIIEPEEVMRKTGYSRPHTVHCGPDGIYISCLGGKGANGDETPAGIFIMDCESFEILGPWEMDHGDQRLSYDFWWHLSQNVAMTSEWGTPRQYENGIIPEDLLSNKYGHRLHFWDLSKRRLKQTIDLGPSHQMALEVRPAHEPNRDYGFLGVVVNTENLNGEIWLWYREDANVGDDFKVKKIIDIPAESADPADLPDLLKGFAAVPPTVTDIDLSLDDKFLYVACWGTGELRQYNVSDPHNPHLAGSVHLGGIVRRTPHPSGNPFHGAPQMLEISRDGRRIYFTNSLYSTWDDQFYPESGMPGVQVLVHADPNGGLRLDPDFYVTFEDGYRAHQIRLEGGDCSTDSFCYSSV
ncbi:selenium-binding protein [Acidihalobacter ferrooxydans]|uniref:Methanethiol oxidase n=2 Tax=Acidihalobacter ferrooxydans TaxID=1765967 RepID=A0A1P8ULA8_9GAMM|nr:selenium-binding protein [Acidihalobacter ferrooxydans]